MTVGDNVLYLKATDTLLTKEFTFAQTLHGPVVGIGFYFQGSWSEQESVVKVTYKPRSHGVFYLSFTASNGVGADAVQDVTLTVIALQSISVTPVAPSPTV